ncbi:MAG: V-type ATP synthase subunit B, partial [Lachnospiraceae bacterium]|nr:V-type ATP synthase subunit B [Lachnospiraceae bacterium]
MGIEYLGLSQIKGPLVAIEGIRGAAYDEIVELHVDDGSKTKKIGKIIEVYDDKAVIQVFEGSENLSLLNTHTRLTGHPLEIPLSIDILGSGISKGCPV